MDTPPANRKTPRPALIVVGIAAVMLLVYGGYRFYYAGSSSVNSYNTSTGKRPAGNDSSEIERQQAVVWYEDAIDILQKRVDRLEEMAIQEQSGLQETYQASLVEMEEELDTLRSQVKQVRRSSPEEWKGLKIRVEETRARIEDKLQNDYRDYSV